MWSVIRPLSASTGTRDSDFLLKALSSSSSQENRKTSAWMYKTFTIILVWEYFFSFLGCWLVVEFSIVQVIITVISSWNDYVLVQVITVIISFISITIHCERCLFVMYTWMSLYFNHYSNKYFTLYTQIIIFIYFGEKDKVTLMLLSPQFKKFYTRILHKFYFYSPKIPRRQQQKKTTQQVRCFRNIDKFPTPFDRRSWRGCHFQNLSLRNRT